MYILRFYGLDGCPACQQAVNFIQSKRVPCEMILANNDPILVAGIKALNNGKDEFPILICSLVNEKGTKDIIVGWKQEEYERVCNVVATFFGSGSWNVSHSEQQPDGQTSSSVAQTASGTN